MTWQKGFSELLAEWRKDTVWKAEWEIDNENLPYELKAQGYDFYVAWIPGDRYGRKRYRYYFAAALVKDRRVEREWDYIPNLTEILVSFPFGW